MSYDFKPGDRVKRVIRAFGNFGIGTEGVVDEVTPMGNLKFSGDPTAYDNTFFKLVKVSPMVITQPAPVKAPEPSPLDTQVDGSHYKDYPIQPIEYSMANKLDACQHSVVKYVTRFRDKGAPLKDLQKARHFIDMLIAFETATPSTPKVKP